MTASTGAGEPTPPQTATTAYAERLYLAWWAWPVPLALAAALAATVHLGYPTVPEWLPYIGIIGGAVAVLLLAGRTRVALVDTAEGPELQAGKARLPAHYLGNIEVIPRQHKRRALGPELDPAAFVLHRGWVGPLVRAEVTDRADPTPYWVISTRSPQTLSELLKSASHSAGRHGGGEQGAGAPWAGAHRAGAHGAGERGNGT